jgi:hypothetical protein
MQQLSRQAPDAQVLVRADGRHRVAAVDALVEADAVAQELPTLRARLAALSMGERREHHRRATNVALPLGPGGQLDAAGRHTATELRPCGDAHRGRGSSNQTRSH